MHFLKIIVLLLFFLGNPIKAMEKEIENKYEYTSNICIDKITSPTWCEKEIEKQLRKNPFIVEEKNNFLLQILTEEAKKLQLTHFTQEEIDKILSSDQFASNQQEDPPFFRLKIGEQDIYILGSKHTIPMFKCLNLPTLYEIKRIAELNPILYTEHEITNELAIAALKDANNQLDNISLKHGLNFFAKVGDGRVSDLKIKFEECIKDKKLFLSIAQESDINISEVSKAKAWLGAVLLGVHANILSFEKFGGIEYELIHEPFWNVYWKKLMFLETSQQVLDTLQQHEKMDSAHNINWAKKSMTSIINFMKCKDDTLDEITKNSWGQILDHYSHKIINFSTAGNTTQSGIMRNSQWPQELADIMNDEQCNTPLLLVIGDAHLLGYKENNSFLSFLIKSSKIKPSLSRFSNQEG